MKFHYKQKVKIKYSSRWGKFYEGMTGNIRSFEDIGTGKLFSVDIENNPHHCVFFKEEDLESCEIPIPSKPL